MSSFNICLKHLGSDENSFWSLKIGMLLHSCLMPNSSCSTVLNVCWQMFHFMMLQMFYIRETSGLQADQFSIQVLLLGSYAVVMDVICGLPWSCWNIPKTDVVWMGADHALKLCYVFFSTDGAFSDVETVHVIENNTNPYIRDSGSWSVHWPQAGWFLSSLDHRTRCSWFPNLE